MAKRLFRSTTDSKIAGICGGLGEYLDLDPTIVRLIAVLLLLAWGASGIAYILAWIIVPQQQQAEAAG